MADDPNDEDLDALLRAAAPPRDRRRDVGDEACTRRVLERESLVVGEYEIGEPIGGGSFGEVRRGYSRTLKRAVAIKCLRHHDADARILAANAEREAVALARLAHPNVVTVHQVLMHGDDTLIVMELVDGQPLSAWQVDRSFSELLDAYLQAAEGLAAIHAAGLLHLDFKPANAIRGEDGRVRVTDLGLAHAPEELVTASDSDTSRRPVPQGTSAYAAPEQLRGDVVDARADQHAFCVALLEAAGMPAKRRAPRPRDVPRRIEAALRRGAAPHPDDRWPDMPALIAELRVPPWYHHRRWWGLGGAMSFALPAALAYVSSGTECSDPRERLVGRWDPAVRNAVVDAFRTNASPWTEEMLSTVVRDLDAYAAAWVRESEATCVAGVGAVAEASVAAHGSRVGEVACLDRALARLGRTTAILADGRGPVLERADDLLRELTPVDDCRLETLAHAISPSPEIAEVTAEADGARLWLAAGRLDDARDAAERAVAIAERSGDAGAMADAKFARGAVLHALGLDQGAVGDLQAAAAHGVAAHRGEVSAMAWRLLTQIAAHNLQDSNRAAAWLQLAEAAVDGLDRPSLLVADVLDARGVFERLRGDAPAAERAHRSAMVALQQQLDDDDPRWARTWMNLAAARHGQGDPAEAGSWMARVIALRTARLGAAHPDVATALLGAAMIAESEGNIDHALAQLETARDIYEDALGPDAVRLAPVLAALARVRLTLGDLEAAEHSARRAWAIQKASLPLHHIERAAGAINILIDVATLRRDYDGALALERERRTEAVARGDDAQLAEIGNNIAWLLCQLRRHEEAAPLYAALRRAKDPSIAAFAAAGLGTVALLAGDHETAIGHLELAMDELSRVGSRDGIGLAEVQWRLAQALSRRGDAAERVSMLAGAALPAFRESGSDEEVADLMAMLSASTPKPPAGSRGRIERRR